MALVNDLHDAIRAQQDEKKLEKANEEKKQEEARKAAEEQKEAEEHKNKIL